MLGSRRSPVVFGRPGAGALEPRLDRELAEIELGRIAEGHVRGARAEVEGRWLFRARARRRAVLAGQAGLVADASTAVTA